MSDKDERTSVQTEGAHGGRAEAQGVVFPVRLTSNENRTGLPEIVRRAIVEAFHDANLYPDDSAVELTEALARRHDVSFDAVVHGHGSTDLLRMAVPALAVGNPSIRLIMADPTFEQLLRYSEPYDARVEHVPLVPGSWAHDVDAMARAAGAEDSPALVYICNPNNPTGTLTPVHPVKEWIEGDRSSNRLFVVDEAYHEFVEDPSYESLASWAVERPNVVVLRTFSKIFAMAGVRVGYAVAHPDTASRLKAFKSGRGPNHLGNRAALAALADPGLLRDARQLNREAREIVYGVLAELDLEAMESHTNFVMHEVGGDVRRYVERMAEAGFQVGRPFEAFPTHNRISLGRPEEMEAWALTLRDFRARGWV